MTVGGLDGRGERCFGPGSSGDEFAKLLLELLGARLGAVCAVHRGELALAGLFDGQLGELHDRALVYLGAHIGLLSRLPRSFADGLQRHQALLAMWARHQLGWHLPASIPDADRRRGRAACPSGFPHPDPGESRVGGGFGRE